MRDLHSKDRAARLALDLHLTAMILDEALYDGEPKPDALRLPMAREGFEDAIADR